LLAACVGVWLGVGLWVPVGGGRQVVRYALRPRQSLHAVALELRAAGLIRSPGAFRLAGAWGNRWRRAHAGDYALRRDMSALEILRCFESGRVIAEWVTVPEGFTVWQIADLVHAKGLGTREQFLRAANSGGAEPAPSLSRGFPPGARDTAVDFPAPRGSLEGYLFPDTYRVGRDAAAPRKLVAMMLARFDEVVWQGLLRGRAPAGISDLKSQISDGAALHEVVILASLVEGEARVAAERPIIAGVLINRLKRGMMLQCDATVQYALGPGNHKPRLTYADLAMPSPYNTYLHPGLPPGPINDPGRASIAAALHPAQVDYLYYVARPDRSHIFSRTLAEHERAKALARRTGGKP
jgi:UPF0755 protein